MGLSESTEVKSNNQINNNNNSVNSVYQSNRIDNPYTEAVLCLGHTDIVRFLVVLPPDHIASGSDDGHIRIWDIITGRCLRILDHRQPITYMASINNQGSFILSAAMDRQIKLWHVNSGRMWSTNPPTIHTSSIKMLTIIDEIFEPPNIWKIKIASNCSDRLLCIWEWKLISVNQGWSCEGELLHQERLDDVDDDINVIFGIKDNTFIVSCDSSAGTPLMILYQKQVDTNKLKILQVLPSVHRLSIRQIVSLTIPTKLPTMSINVQYNNIERIKRKNIDTFVSASMDGILAVWQLDDDILKTKRTRNYIVLLYQLNSHRIFFDKHGLKKLLFKITHVLPAVIHNDKYQYIAAASGCGFVIYDVYSNKTSSDNDKRLIVRVPNAHDADINYLCWINQIEPYSSSTYTSLITVSCDGATKCWYLPHSKGGRLQPLGLVNLQPYGSTTIHHRDVQQVIALPPIAINFRSISPYFVNPSRCGSASGFATCGSDGMVVLVKNRYLLESLKNISAIGMDIVSIKNDISMNDRNNASLLISSLSEPTISEIQQDGDSVSIETGIIKAQEYLKSNMSKEQISFHLRALGYSDNMIKEVREEIGW